MVFISAMKYRRKDKDLLLQVIWSFSLFLLMKWKGKKQT